MVTLLKAQFEIVSFVSWASGPSTEILIPGAFIKCPQLAMKGMLTLVWSGQSCGDRGSVKGGFLDTASFKAVLLSECRSPSRETFASRAS